MLLSGFNLLHYLLSNRLISYQNVFEKGCSIEPVQSRNFSFKVSSPGGEHLFVKQIDFPEPDKIQTLRTEATCYWLAKNQAALQGLENIFPGYIHFDQYHHILVTQQVEQSTELYQYFRLMDAYPIVVAKQLGKILASFHQDLFDRIVESQTEKLFKKAIPGPFILFGEQLPLMQSRTDTEAKMKGLILAQEGFSEQIEKVKSKWNKTCLIHGDIKFQNFLVVKKEDNSAPTIKLIDWETADIGDPMWDCAAIIQGYLLSWLFAKSLEDDGDREEVLKKVLPSIHAFWSEYCLVTNQSEETHLTKLVEFCAIKLIHTCYESNVHAAHFHQSGAEMLQLSLHMLSQPQEIIEELLEFKNVEYA